MNNHFKAIEKNQNMSTEMLQQKQLKDFLILHNMTSESKNEIEQLGRYHNLSFSLFQQNLDKQLQKSKVQYDLKVVSRRVQGRVLGLV